MNPSIVIHDEISTITNEQWEKIATMGHKAQQPQKLTSSEEAELVELRIAEAEQAKRVMARRGTKLFGDPRTTGRLETASQRKHRKRLEARQRAGAVIRHKVQPDGQCHGRTGTGSRCKNKVKPKVVLCKRHRGQAYMAKG